MVDASQRRAAIVFGVIYMVAHILIIVAFRCFYLPIFVSTSVVETARNIATHEHSYRIYIALSLAYGVGSVVLPTALYVILRPVSRGEALFATFSRLAYAFLWFVMLTDSLGALRVMTGGGYLQVFDQEHLQALAGFQLAHGGDLYYAALTFHGLGTVAFSWVWLKSRYIPRTLATWGILASLFEGVCAFSYLISPSFGKIVSVDWYEMPMLLFEFPLSLWLLIRGLRAVPGQSAG